MKHFLLAREGLKQIPESDLLAYREHGSFMAGSGPLTMPTMLEDSDAGAIEGLLAKGQNFAYWFTPDCRAKFVTKDGAIKSNGKWWKIAIEWRSITRDGRTTSSAARSERRLPTEAVVSTIRFILKDLVTTLRARSEERGADDIVQARELAAEVKKSGADMDDVPMVDASGARE